MTDTVAGASGSATPDAAAAVFRGAGEMAARCRAFDWAATPLGPVADWPASLRTAAALVLGAGFPMILLWGPDLVQLYNDGYVPFLAAKHPAGLGRPTREVWPEVWHLNAPVYARVLAGETVALEEAHFPVRRRGDDGPEEDLYVTLAYSPVPDDAGAVSGVLVTLRDVTAEVAGRAAEAERARLAAALEGERTVLLEEVFRRAPSFLHVLRGPDFVFEFANAAYYQLVGHRALLGRPAFEALPEAAGGGFPERLAAVMATGEPFVGRELPVTLARTPGAPPEERLIDLVYLPLPDADGRGPRGACTRVLGHGTDVTEHVRARTAADAERARLVAELRGERERQAFLLALSDRLRPLTDPAEIQATAARALGEHVGASRAGYAEIAGDLDGDAARDAHAVVARHYTDAGPGIAGRYRVADFGPALLRGLRAGRTVVRADVAADPALTGPEKAAHAAVSVGTAVDVPLVKAGRLAAVLFLHRRDARPWSPDDLALAEAVAERTWDAVERARAEAALRTSEARFRTVQDASPLGFAIHRPVRAADDAGGDAPGRVVDFTTPYVNAAGARIAGQPREAILAGTVLENWPWVAQEGVFADYVRVLETGEPAHRELLFEQDGLAAGFAITAVRIGSGPEAELGTTFTDVTARLRAERERARLLAELTAERERLRALILHMPAPVALTDGPEHRFVLVNEAYQRVSGGGRDVTGLTPREAFPELAGQGIHELFDRVYATDAPWEGPETLVRYDRDGTGVRDTWFDLRLEPVRDGGGRVVGVLNFNVDVTAQVVARRAVEGLLADAEAARGEAERANHAKSEFLAVMSHELRTPLNAIGGYAELMEMGIRGPVTPEQRADLERIQRAQRHLLGLINGVLNYAKIDAGAVHYQLEAVALDEVLGACEALVAPQVRAKGLALRREGDGSSADGSPAGGPPLRVRADREKLQQVLLNLLSNAVKFTEPGGALALRCAAVPAGADGPGGPAVRIQVADTGIGIAPHQLGRVFEPFVQVDQRLTRAGEGTGLGLAISRDLARGMGGDLTAESTPGVGSTFTLTLPSAAPG